MRGRSSVLVSRVGVSAGVEERRERGATRRAGGVVRGGSTAVVARVRDRACVKEGADDDVVAAGGGVVEGDRAFVVPGGVAGRVALEERRDAREGSALGGEVERAGAGHRVGRRREEGRDRRGSLRGGPGGAVRAQGEACERESRRRDG